MHMFIFNKKQFSILTVTFFTYQHTYIPITDLTALSPPGLSEIKYFLRFVTNQQCKQKMRHVFLSIQ